MGNKEPKKTGKITLKIGGKPYKFNVLPEQGELYRLAERQVAEGIKKFEKLRLEGFAMQDYLALVALDQALSNVVMQRSRGVGDEQMQALDELSREVDSFLNTPRS